METPARWIEAGGINMAFAPLNAYSVLAASKAKSECVVIGGCEEKHEEADL